ncbi:hypothetical protein H6P81_019935 [Aristolochia fimbriata]|uniref:Uncharacterized protein n=1 Tax=Aristolochia fimbriata TaxID=158543 RepID=A0AAV7DT61_ARIFI|nr:hypothetical protein H6P81_019935 [Aristolochia fimbriata]
MKAKLPDARPLINICGRFGFVPDLTHYHVNPGNAPLVVVQLLDDECPEDFIKGLTLSVRSLLPEELLLEQYEERNRLHLLTQFLDHFVRESSQDVFVHISLGKIIGDSNNNPEHFLQPILTMTLEWWLQARYVVERMDPELWEKVLSPDNEFRRQLIDQVVSTSLPESKSPEQVSAAVKAIKADPSRVMVIYRLDNFDGPAVGDVAVKAALYDEAFVIFKKLN